MGLVGKTKEKLKKNRIFALVLESYSVRTWLFALLSLAISLFFTVANLVSAVLYKSGWYGVQAGYYGALVLYRGIILPFAASANRRHPDDPDGLRRAKLKLQLSGGAFLVIVTLAMCAASTYLVISGKPQQGNTVTAIATAVYTFWKIIMGSVNLFRAGKTREIVAVTLRKLNFCDACMSVISLTVLMLTVFSGESDASWALFLEAAVCFSGCALALGISAHMIITAVRGLGLERRGREAGAPAGATADEKNSAGETGSREDGTGRREK